MSHETCVQYDRLTMATYTNNLTLITISLLWFSPRFHSIWTSLPLLCDAVETVTIKLLFCFSWPPFLKSNAVFYEQPNSITPNLPRSFFWVAEYRSCINITILKMKEYWEDEGHQFSCVCLRSLDDTRKTLYTIECSRLSIIYFPSHVIFKKRMLGNNCLQYSSAMGQIHLRTEAQSLKPSRFVLILRNSDRYYATVINLIQV